MRIAWKFVVAGALCGAAVATTGILAQPPEREKKGAQPAQPKRDGGERKSSEPVKADPAVDAWVKVLLEKLTDPHDTVRDSARAGLVTVGRQAVPSLQKLADGEDGAKATAARKLIGEIQGREQRQGGFGNPGFPGPGGGFPDGRPPVGPGQPGLPGGNEPGRGGPGGIGGQAGPLGGPLAGVERIVADLKLSDKEQKQVKELIEKAKKEAQEIMAEAREKNVGREELGKAMEKMHEALFKGLKPLLTDEQFERLEKAMSGRRPGQPEEPRPGGRPKPPE